MLKITVFSEEELERIRLETEDFFETHGVQVQHPGLVELARRSGAVIAGDMVRFPRELLRELLAKAPSQYEVRGIGGYSAVIGDGVPKTGAIVTDPWILDYPTGQRRRPTLEDVRRNTILAQTDPDVVQTYRMEMPVAEYADATSSLRALQVHLQNHTKHCHAAPTSMDEMRDILALAELLADSDGTSMGGLFTISIPMLSPLVLTKLNGELLIETVKNGFIVLPTICPMAGSTAPYTRIGSFFCGHIESLAVAVLAQMLRPGTPFLYMCSPSVTDLRSGHDRYYTLEKVAWKTAAAQICRHYRIPSAVEAGGTMNPSYDMQSGAESMLFMFSAYASGVDFMSGIGSCCNAVGLSSEMILIQRAFREAVKHIAKGLPLDLLGRSIESLKETGAGGNFLTDELTLELMRSGEFSRFDGFNMACEFEIGTPMLELAHEWLEEIVSGFVSPVPGKVREALDRFFQDRFHQKG